MPKPHTPAPDRPATTRAKAELCEALEPVLASLHAELRVAAPKHLEKPAAEQALALARVLAADVGTLLSREPALRYLGPLSVRDPCDQMSLLVTVAALQSAVAAFRARYHGWHEDERAFGWRLLGRPGEDTTVRALAPSAAAPRSAGAGERQEQARPIEDLRERLAERLEEVANRKAWEMLRAQSGPLVRRRERLKKLADRGRRLPELPEKWR